MYVTAYSKTPQLIRPQATCPELQGMGGGRGARGGVWGDLSGKGKSTLSTELIDGVMYENIQMSCHPTFFFRFY